ncbi:hypothetical protein F383_06762 [Gossypium arboreum]|uniref:Uncharacterized protein n=1 Tax=Gossypium arboreum TaxID=29729 RepID=A0A0B0NPV3_GOSAR|nr:hypothetical protein F383_06762 [Gossypium arboreum]
MPSQIHDQSPCSIRISIDGANDTGALSPPSQGMSQDSMDVA